MERINHKSGPVFFAIVIFMASLMVFCFGCSNKGEKHPIEIGRILPLTGPAASYGQSEKRGTDLAVEEINKAGGIQGRKLEVLYEDDACASKEGVSAMRKLVNVEKVPLVLGATCSTVTLAISPIANANKVVLLSPLSSAAQISNAGPYVFRVIPVVA